jgi:hypothetical protein
MCALRVTVCLFLLFLLLAFYGTSRHSSRLSRLTMTSSTCNSNNTTIAVVVVYPPGRCKMLPRALTTINNTNSLPDTMVCLSGSVLPFPSPCSARQMRHVLMFTESTSPRLATSCTSCTLLSCVVASPSQQYYAGGSAAAAAAGIPGRVPHPIHPHAGHPPPIYGQPQPQVYNSGSPAGSHPYGVCVG